MPYETHPLADRLDALNAQLDTLERQAEGLRNVRRGIWHTMAGDGVAIRQLALRGSVARTTVYRAIDDDQAEWVLWDDGPAAYYPPADDGVEDFTPDHRPGSWQWVPDAQ